MVVFGGVSEVDSFCSTLVGWFILVIAVMLVGCSGFSYALHGWYFPYVQWARQEELVYLGDMYCRRIENLDWDASCMLCTKIYYL